LKVVVYVVEHEVIWSLRISLDIKIDLNWWSGGRRNTAEGDIPATGRMFILSESLPLGWAVQLRDSFVYRNGMREWGREDWGDYTREILEKERAEEKEVMRQVRAGERFAGWDIDPGQRKGNTAFAASEQHLGGTHYFAPSREVSGCSGGSASFEMEAEKLAQLMAGRSLLEPELTAMLSEHSPELLEHWRSAAQLAHLQGRLKLEAAAARPAHGTGARLRNRQPPQGAGDLWPARAAAAWLPRLRGLWRGAVRRRALPRCLRCGSTVTARTACAACGLAGCAYCEACLALGRSRACALLLRSAALPAVRGTAGFDPAAAARRWGLGAAQAEAAGAALGFLAERHVHHRPSRFLLWAVTGAGKTEMIFPLLESILLGGGRVLVATPRRDVVLELAPRLARAFPEERLAVLYGGSPDRWSGGGLTLATTHQLLRFHQGFDMVIIDELDAFPYHNDPMLAYAAEQACKPDGTFIYLSATPPEEMQRQVKQGRLTCARVPVRFHGHPLPEPEHLPVPSIATCLNRGVLPKLLLQKLRKSLDRNAQIFMFVPRIAHIDRLLEILRRSLPGVVIAGTSSQDPARTGKVSAFRSREISILVTTTILERGVTVPRSDVFIMDADSTLFDEAALVQMAGRAGRSKDDPAGLVVLASPQWGRSQRGAAAQISAMNRIARQKGYFQKEQQL